MLAAAQRERQAVIREQFAALWEVLASHAPARLQAESAIRESEAALESQRAAIEQFIATTPDAAGWLVPEAGKPTRLPHNVVSEYGVMDYPKAGE